MSAEREQAIIFFLLRSAESQNFPNWACYNEKRFLVCEDLATVFTMYSVHTFFFMLM